MHTFAAVDRLNIDIHSPVYRSDCPKVLAKFNLRDNRVR